MEMKSTPETDEFLYFDPKLLRASEKYVWDCQAVLSISFHTVSN